MKDYLDKESVKKNPEARAIAQEINIEVQQKERAERDKYEEEQKEQREKAREERENTIKYFDSLEEDKKEMIDWNTNLYMEERYSALKNNLPKVYEDYRKQTKLQETTKYRNNPTLYVRNERPNPETPESERVQGG